MFKSLLLFGLLYLEFSEFSRVDVEEKLPLTKFEFSIYLVVISFILSC
jgi:hypothetical protein